MTTWVFLKMGPFAWYPKGNPKESLFGAALLWNPIRFAALSASMACEPCVAGEVLVSFRFPFETVQNGYQQQTHGSRGTFPILSRDPSF